MLGIGRFGRPTAGIVGAIVLALVVACGGSSTAVVDHPGEGATRRDGAPAGGAAGVGEATGARGSGGGDPSVHPGGPAGSGGAAGGGRDGGTVSVRTETTPVPPQPLSEPARREIRDRVAQELAESALMLPLDVEVIEVRENTFELRGDLGIDTPAGEIPLVDAVLTVTVEPAGVTWRGVAELPFPAFGPFEQSVVKHTSRAEIGYQYGRDLRGLGAHLNDDRAYFYFTFSDGLEIATGFAALFGEGSSLPESISVPGGTSGVMVLDPTDPYIYIGGACPTFPGDRSESRDESRDDDGHREGADSESDPVEISLHESDGQDCGIGFSLNAAIPFDPIDGNWLSEGGAFNGQLAIDAIVPLYHGLSVDGSVVTEFGATSYAQGGNGRVLVSVPFVENILAFEIPLGNASAGLNVETAAGQERVYAFFSGTFTSDGATSFLPDEVARMIPMADSDVRIAGHFGLHTGADGVTRVNADSFLRATGSFGYDPGFLGELTGLDLSELMVARSELRIDRQGFLLTGSTSSRLHPSLGFAGEVAVTAFVSTERLADSYIELRGDLSVAGVRLDSGALVRLDGTGLHVSGHFVTPVQRIELSGEITAQGVELHGLTRVEFPLDLLAGIAADAEAGLDEAIAEVERLDIAIAFMREQVMDERRATSADFQTAQQALRLAQAEVDKMQADIDHNLARIAVRNREIASFNRWYDRLAWYDQAWGWTKLGYEVGWRGTEIAGRYTAIGTLELSRETAKLALSTAEGTLWAIDQGLTAIPVDADPRVAGLIVARVAATETLEASRLVAQAAQNGGTLSTEIRLDLDTSGLSGQAQAEYCDVSGCQVLVGGRLAFTPLPEITLVIAGFEVSAAF
jgi:hypothetical protein